MVNVPPSLRPGDTIAITCPAGYMTLEKAATCIQTLKDWGYQVRLGKTLGSSSTNYFSGTDTERQEEFQAFMDDPTIKAILCARGGYGCSRIIDGLSFKRFKQFPKWIIGYSDVTVFHCHLYAKYKIASLHAPMASAFNDGGASDPFVLSLKTALEGGKSKYTLDPHPFNRTGKAIGELVGGNLSLLAHLTGTATALKTKGRILFIEDVGEFRYNIDRMLLQLKRAGKLDKLAGLVVGGFTDEKDTDRPFGKTTEEIIRDAVAEYDYPVCFGFPVSHGKENVALKVGVGYGLLVGKGKVVLEARGERLVDSRQ